MLLFCDHGAIIRIRTPSGIASDDRRHALQDFLAGTEVAYYDDAQPDAIA